MNAKTKLLIPSLALALLCSAQALAGTVYRVGAGCTYTTIQAAINAIPDQGDGTIRIRGGTYNENLVINNKTVELLGGHNDCTGTGATGITHIDASGSASPVITFRVNLGTAGTSHLLSTDKLNLFDGTGSGTAYGGGISVYVAADLSATLNLSRTFIRDNSTNYRGGGIALRGEGSGSLAMVDNSQIEGNSVTGDNPYGGGLYCAGDFAVIMIGGSIHGNTAGVSGDDHARGGGIYLNGCDMTWYAQDQTAPTDDAALRNNTAYGGTALSGGSGGGGLYATGGAQVDFVGAHFTFGDPASTRPLRIHHNLAQAISDSGAEAGSGSAVFASGAGTRVRLDRTWVYQNTSNDRGPFYALGGAEIIIERGSELCHNPRRCSRVFDNTGGLTAVAMSHGAGSAIRFRRTIVSGNSATDGTHITATFENQFGGTIDVDDSLVFGNSSSVGFHIYMDGSPTLRVRRSTVANNHFENSFPTFTSTVFRIAGDNTTVAVWDSIIHEPGTDMANDYESFWDPTIHVDCVVWHDDQLGSFGTLVADPLFVDPGNDKYYLQSASPAINFCNIAPPAPGTDLDWNPRGLCHSTSGDCSDGYRYDVGAYELPLVIFQDRFEDSP